MRSNKGSWNKRQNIAIKVDFSACKELALDQTTKRVIHLKADLTGFLAEQAPAHSV